MDFDELPVQNIQLRFTASAVVVRTFGEDFLPLQFLGVSASSNLKYTSRGQGAWLTVFFNIYFGCALIG